MEQSKNQTKPRQLAPPDGGYGWVVLFASFMLNFIVDGVCFSFGIFYLEFLDFFQETKAITSWAGSILNGMYLFTGPFTSALCTKFGCRTVCITGSVLAAFSFALSTISPSVDVLILLYGAMAGVGFGFMYFPSIVMVGFYFEKKRALATGLTVCASGVGAFVCAPLFKMLIYQYDWQGATLIMAGMVLNGTICGALLRPPPTVDIVDTDTKTRVCTDISPIDVTVDSTAQECNISTCKVNQTLYPSTDIKKWRENCKRHKYIVTRSSLDEGCGSNKPNEDLAVQLVSLKKTEEQTNSPLVEVKDAKRDCVENMLKEEGNACKDKPCNKPVVANVFDFSLLRSPTFLVYGMSCFLCMTGFYVPFTYLPDRAKQLDINGESAAFLISIVGIANTITRVCTGLLADRSCVDNLVFNNIALLIGGASVIAMPHCDSYTMLACSSTLFGMSIAVFVSLRSILMVELLGLEKLGRSFGLVTMFQGLSAFIGAPIAGALFDETDVFDYSFYMAGATLAAAGLICLPLRIPR